MDVLTNKRYNSFDYVCRYTGVPYYYNTESQKDIYGIGQNLDKDTPWVAHKVVQEDTLDSLALKYYNNPTYWWIIAYFNDIQDSLEPLKNKFSIIKIPSISTITFGDLR